MVEVDRGEGSSGAGGIESGGGGGRRGRGWMDGWWVAERLEAPKEEAGGRIPLSPFSKSHSSEADGRAAPIRSTPLAGVARPKKVQHRERYIGEGADPCAGGKRERAGDEAGGRRQGRA